MNKPFNLVMHALLKKKKNLLTKISLTQHGEILVSLHSLYATGGGVIAAFYLSMSNTSQSPQQ